MNKTLQGTDGVRGYIEKKPFSAGKLGQRNPLKIFLEKNILIPEFFELYAYGFCQYLLQEKLAAKKLVEDGYSVGFHFDPLIYYEGWKEGYFQIIDFLAKNIKQEKIVWISIGTLRYVPKLKKIAEERFPKMDLFCSEFAPTADGKMKYIRPIREMLCSYVSQLLQQKFPKVPRYLCMEQRSVWERPFFDKLSKGQM